MPSLGSPASRPVVSSVCCRHACGPGTARGCLWARRRPTPAPTRHAGHGQVSMPAARGTLMCWQPMGTDRWAASPASQPHACAATGTPRTRARPARRRRARPGRRAVRARRPGGSEAASRPGAAADEAQRRGNGAEAGWWRPRGRADTAATPRHAAPAPPAV